MGRSYKRQRVSRPSVSWNMVNQAARWASRARTAINSARRASEVVRRGRNIVSGLRTSVPSSSRPRATSVSMASTVRRGRMRRYVTTGKVGKKYRKANRISYDKFVKSGAITKAEYGGVIEGADCVYVGHYTLDLNRVISTCMYSLARRLLEMKAIYVQDPLEKTLISNNLTVFCRYRTSVGGQVDTSSVGTTINANASLANIGDQIGKEIVTKISSSTTYFEVVKIIIQDAVTFEPWLTVNGGNIFFDVVGNSNLQMQNRTLASNLTSEPTRYSANDVTNNPLRGKQYEGMCNLHQLKFLENKSVPAAIDSFYYSNNTGVLAINSIGATVAPFTTGSFSTEVSQALKKPPLPSMFTNVNRVSYVQLLPGEVRRSNIKSSFRMGLNKLIGTYLPALRGTTETFALNECYISKGKNRMFAYEKMCDTGLSSEDSGISVGYENVCVISSLCFIKKKVAMNPFVLPI